MHSIDTGREQRSTTGAKVTDQISVFGCLYACPVSPDSSLCSSERRGGSLAGELLSFLLKMPVPSISTD